MLLQKNNEKYFEINWGGLRTTPMQLNYFDWTSVGSESPKCLEHRLVKQCRQCLGRFPWKYVWLCCFVVWCPPILWEHLSQIERIQVTLAASPPLWSLCENIWVSLSNSEWTDPWTKKTLNIIESFWFHLVEIETIWETGQLTTKTCNWDSLIFFWVILISFLFGCWLFGNVVSSNLRHLQSAPSFIPASCSKPVKLHTESVRNISRFQHLKMASQFLWKKCREDSVSFGLFRVAFECSASMFETFWMFLRLKKIIQNVAFPQGHLLSLCR